jgi:FixJ family two-component response regulator
MSYPAPIVFIVDDDISVRESVEMLVGGEGWQAETFASAEEFLSRPAVPAPSCLVLDVALPDLNGLDLQERVAMERPAMPIIFITGCGDVPMTVRAMNAGEVEFFTKPFDDAALLGAIRTALERSSAVLARAKELDRLRERYASLSRREQEVMALVVAGLLNKQVGGELGISEITVKAHREKVMRKMKARSLPALVKMALKLELEALLTRYPARSASPRSSFRRMAPRSSSSAPSPICATRVPRKTATAFDAAPANDDSESAS